ncbi:MAG: DNA polymerase III subunit delta [Treponema sp.]|jgi:DNA polymerase-3 subunit delta|nr:DNA polymerase III subunit delta [Treponema sp.]
MVKAVPWGCHLFLGPELGRKEDAVGELREKLAKEAPPSLVEEFLYYAGETPASEICDILRNGSLFAEKRLFFIKNADAFKKNEAEILAPVLASLPPLTAAVLISGETRLAKSLEDAAGRGKQIFWELFENEKTEWIHSFFHRNGYRVEEEAAATILEMVENNTAALRRECSRICLFMTKQPDNTLNAAMAEEWLSHTREESAFILFSRIARGDLSRSLESLHTLLAAKESPPAILAGLAWCFRKLRDYLALTGAGGAGDADFRKMGLAAPKARADYAEAAKRYGGAAVDLCLALTAEYDILARRGGAGLEPVLMDLYLVKILHAAHASR